MLFIRNSFLNLRNLKIVSNENKSVDARAFCVGLTYLLETGSSQGLKGVDNVNFSPRLFCVQSNCPFPEKMTKAQNARKIMKVIVLKNKGERGKTETLTELLSVFQLNGCSHLCSGRLGLDKSQKDFWAHFVFKGKKIGIVSAGDPKNPTYEISPPQKEKLEEFLKNGDSPFDIIVCASRTKGEPLEIINHLFSKDSLVWFSNFTAPNNPNIHKKLNKNSAQAIFALVDDLITK